MACLQDKLGPLEKAIRESFLPALFGGDITITDNQRRLFALPTRLGGLAINDPTADALQKHRDSRDITEPVVTLIRASVATLPVDINKKVRERARIIKLSHQNALLKEQSRVREHSPEETKRAIDLASEKGASAALSVIPLEKFGFCFKSKRDFHDFLRTAI